MPTLNRWYVGKRDSCEKSTAPALEKSPQKRGVCTVSPQPRPKA